MFKRLAIPSQPLVSLLILLFVPTNAGKALALMVWWSLTFGKPTRREVLLFLAVNSFFMMMNAIALRQGIFAFSDPDFLGMPMWEPFMWGFYTLHTLRFVGGPPPPVHGGRWLVWALAAAFALCFATIGDATLLLLASAAVLAVALALFHESRDLAYTGYMIFVGALFEYAGVHSGLWSYPGDPPGGVPLWFATMWGGVGLFLRRLALPLVAKRSPVSLQESRGTAPDR
jgi:hypothetical protein